MKTEFWKRNRKLFAVIVFAAILIGCYSVAVYRCEYNVYFERDAEAIASYYNGVCSNLIRKTDFRNTMEQLSKQKQLIRGKILMSNLLQQSDGQETTLSASNTGVGFYRLDSKLNPIDKQSQTNLPLSEDQLSQLTGQKYIEIDQRCYYAEAAENGYYVLAWDADEDIFSGINYELSKAVSYVIWDNRTGELLECNLEQLPDGMKTRELAASELNVLTSVDGIEIGTFTLDGKSCLSASGIFTEGDTDVTVCIFTDEWQAQRNAFFVAAAAAFLAALFAVSCCLLLARLRKKRYSGESRQRKFHFIQDYHRQLKFSVSFITIVFICMSLILSSLQTVLIIGNTASNAFRALSQIGENRSQNQSTVYDITVQVYIDYANQIAGVLNYSDNIDLDDWLAEVAESFGLEEIILYDENGIVTHSTTPYRGYRLSTDETKQEYKLWEILNGGVKKLVYHSEEENRTYVAVRRTDAVGILCLGLSEDLLNPLSGKEEVVDLFRGQNYLDAYRLYLRRDDPKTLCLLKPGSTAEKTLTNTFPVPEDGETTIGTRNIDEEICLYVDAGGSDWVMVIAYPVTSLVKESLPYLALTVAVYLLTALGIYFAFSKSSFGNTTQEDVSEAYSEFSAERKKTVRLIISLLAVLSCVIVLRGIVILGGTTFSVFFGCWEKGLNLISLYRIILSTAVLAGFSYMIDSLNSLLCRLLRQRGATICTLISKVIKFVLLIIYLVVSMDHLGVDAATILTSLGLVGLAVSIGSKDVIGDLVAGLFIAFEGQLQLGDFVEANSFMGEITSLGIRTTTIKQGNMEMVVNNTAVKNVLNYSRGLCQVWIGIVLPYDTDPDRVKQLIEASEERFFQACDGNLLGKVTPFGVTDYKSYGMEYKVWGITSTSFDAYCRCAKDCRTELIKILNENGIHPAVSVQQVQS